jgi:hypothetical protein
LPAELGRTGFRTFTPGTDQNDRLIKRYEMMASLGLQLSHGYGFSALRDASGPFMGLSDVNEKTSIDVHVASLRR